MITGRDVISRLDEIRRNDPAVDEFIRKLSALGPVALAGGAIRDWQLGFNHHDLDFVVDTTPAALITAFEGLNSVRNAFRGMRATIGQQEIDAWPLSHTLAFLAGDIDLPFTFERLSLTTFLNAESANVRLDNAVMSEHGFSEGIRDGMLELNFGTNPYPVNCAAKAIVLAERHDWTLGPELVSWFHRPRCGISFAEGYSKRGLEREDVERCILRKYPEHKIGDLAERYGLFIYDD